MASDEDEETRAVLQAILLGMVVADNAVEDARQTLVVLGKLVDNAIANPREAKFRRVPCGNERISRRICNTPGASEFMDAIQFNRVDDDFILLDDARLEMASQAVQQALAALPAAPAVVKSTVAVASATSSTDEYESRRREAEQRQAQVARKQEEERRRKDEIAARIRAEQREVQARPVTASHAVHIQRNASAGASAGGGGGAGQIVFCNSDREFQALLSSKQFVLVNFTASWCGPCQQIAPQVEQLARANPHIQFCKVDIDANQETPGQFNVSAVPTFILFKQGRQVGDQVKGANAAAVQQLVQLAK